MIKYKQRDIERLSTCDISLQKVFYKVAETFPHIIIFGHRNKESQDKAFAEKKSKLQWPDSKHNSLPSKAVDAAPLEYPAGKETIDWNDIRRLCYFAGIVMATAKSMGIALRWGGDWDGDTELKDNTFNDLVHFELLTTNKENQNG